MITVKYYTTANSTNFMTVKDFGSCVTYIYESRNTSSCLIKTCSSVESYFFFMGKLGVDLIHPSCTERLEGELSFVGKNKLQGINNGETFDIL
jgi:hypothetical protein